MDNLNNSIDQMVNAPERTIDVHPKESHHQQHSTDYLLEHAKVALRQLQEVEPTLTNMTLFLNSRSLGPINLRIFSERK